jgi:hypothetical protein
MRRALSSHAASWLVVLLGAKSAYGACAPTALLEYADTLRPLDHCPTTEMGCMKALATLRPAYAAITMAQPDVIRLMPTTRPNAQIVNDAWHSSANCVHQSPRLTRAHSAFRTSRPACVIASEPERIFARVCGSLDTSA